VKILKNNIPGTKDNHKKTKTFNERMLDLLNILCVKYKRVFPIYINGRGPTDSYNT
jgi:hypothetical protein